MLGIFGGPIRGEAVSFQRRLFHFGDQGVGEGFGGGGAVQVGSEIFSFGEDGVVGGFDFVSDVGFMEVVEHHDAGHEDGQGIGDALAGDVGGGAVDGFEDGGVVTHVGAGHDAQPTDEAGAHVADDVAVEIFHEQDVKAGGVLDEFHATGVDDELVVANGGKFGLVDLAAQSRNRPSESFMMLALWKTVTRLRWRSAAYLKA